jgi:hypothetical protein
MRRYVTQAGENRQVLILYLLIFVYFNFNFNPNEVSTS